MKNNKYKKSNGDRGFVALTLVLTVSSLLLAFAFMQTTSVAHFFDLTIRKEYRLMNFYNAGSCIDQAILFITHDYFFEAVAPIKIPEFNCSIDKVRVDGDVRYIEAMGIYKEINVKRNAQVRVFVDRLEVIDIK